MQVEAGAGRPRWRLLGNPASPGLETSGRRGQDRCDQGAGAEQVGREGQGRVGETGAWGPRCFSWKQTIERMGAGLDLAPWRVTQLAQMRGFLWTRTMSLAGGGTEAEGRRQLGSIGKGEGWRRGWEGTSPELLLLNDATSI